MDLREIVEETSMAEDLQLFVRETLQPKVEKLFVCRKTCNMLRAVKIQDTLSQIQREWSAQQLDRMAQAAVQLKYYTKVRLRACRQSLLYVWLEGARRGAGKGSPA
jgi:hypothetical protein